MVMLIDIGNTRTKWAQLNGDGSLSTVKTAVNKTVADSAFKEDILNVDSAMIANVAGDAMQEALEAIMPKTLDVIYATAEAHAADVTNQYEPEALGVDRWAAVVAAWHMNKQPSIVINAGTAITIDMLSRDPKSRQGAYLGGSIMPGLQLMYRSLADSTAELPIVPSGGLSVFPKNTQAAIQTGCMSAVVGAVVLQLKQLEKYSAFLPKVVISGGDAVTIAEALKPQLNRVIIEENLVLKGLALLQKDYL